MKKRTKKVLSFGVAALMAVSALPFSALSVSASIPTKQTENGGTPYNFLLEEQGSGVQTISISKDEIAAGDVTKTLDVFIDSEEWPDDNYLSSVKLNWVATKDATFADGGAIANSIYYQNVFNASTKVNQHDVTMPNGLGTIVGTPYSGAFCMSPMFEEDEDLHTWSYNDAQSNGVVREIACDKIFGANLIANGDNKVKFEYDYYANADDYLADKNADKATHKSHKVQECDVKQKEDGTPYIEYSYINPGGEVAANYVEKTVTVDLPCYSTTRFVKDSDGNDCVPDINNYYSWGFIAASSDDRTYFVGGKSTDLRFTSFDVVVPKDTAEGTYYVQICSRNANKDLIPMPSAADFDSVKADQENYRATVGPLEDMSTAIQGKKDAATYSLPQDPSKAIVKIVVGDGTVTDTTTTAAETTTTENSTTAATTAATTVTTDDKSDEFAWKIGEVACEPGDKKVKLEVTQTNGISTTGIVGSMIVPEATRKILSVPSSYKKISNCFKIGDAYPALSQTMMNTQEYSETGRLVFSMSSNGSMGIVSGNTLAAFTMDVADKDTVTAAAKEAGLELKSDKNGKYYLFPVTWMEDGVDIGYSDDGKGNLTPVEVKRFDYRDTEDNDVHTQVKYIDGGFKVYVDSPLAIEATRVFAENYLGCYDTDAMALVQKGINPLTFQGLEVAVTPDDSMAINFDKSPKVIISASGMCEAGRIRHHLKHNLWRPECTILFVGYQAIGTLGRNIIEGEKEVRLFGETITVNAHIEELAGVSGHADKKGLLNWVNHFEKKPERVFVVHGEDLVCEDFTKCLKEEYGYNAFAPYSGACFDLAANQMISEGVKIPVAPKELPRGHAASEGGKRAMYLLSLIHI